MQNNHKNCISALTSDHPRAAELVLTGAEASTCHKDAPAQETLLKQTAEVVFLPWENCLHFFPAPLPSLSRFIKAA